MHTLKKRELPSNILRYVLLLLGGAVIALINSYLLRRVFHRAFGLD